MIEWLKNSVIYEIYPTSFYDSNGDGIGDLAGIAQKLDYVKDLGVNAIWVNPFYKSPFQDGGYDVSDYYAIDKKFGNMSDFENLIKQSHDKGIRVIVDLVVGHTSDKHPWFKQSKRAKKNRYSDWYVWTDSVFVGAPNCIKGLAERDGNYLVNYYAFQPALNYGWASVNQENDDPWNSETWKMHYKDERLKPLREEIENVVLFWLGKGVDGFRVDLASSLVKGGDVDALAWLWSQIIGKAKEYNPECVFMSEWGNPEDAAKCGFDIDYIFHCSRGYNEMFRGDPGSNLLRAFECGHSYFSVEGKGSKKPLIDYLNELTPVLNDGLYCIPSGYHDIIRQSFGKSQNVLKCIFAFLLTYKNVPMIYYGDEIGMTHNFAVNKDGGYVRTGARTPMQWNNGKNRGFSVSEKLYLPVSSDEKISVETQAEDKNSLYNTVKNLLKLRKENPVFGWDAETTMLGDSEYPMVYRRKLGECSALIAINPTSKSYTLPYSVKGVLYSFGGECKENSIVLSGESFLIGLE